MPPAGTMPAGAVLQGLKPHYTFQRHSGLFVRDLRRGIRGFSCSLYCACQAQANTPGVHSSHHRCLTRNRHCPSELHAAVASERNIKPSVSYKTNNLLLFGVGQPRTLKCCLRFRLHMIPPSSFLLTLGPSMLVSNCTCWQV